MTDDQTLEVYKNASAEAQSQLNKEHQDIEQSISGIVDVQVLIIPQLLRYLIIPFNILYNQAGGHLQMKEIQDKLVHFEELELLMEKEWQQLKYMKDLLFADQLTFLQQKPRLSQKL